MARNRRAREDEPADGLYLDGDATGFDASQYIPPQHELNLDRAWKVPEARTICDDIKSCGYSVHRLVHAICTKYGKADQLGLLGAIIERVKCDPSAYSDFVNYQAVAEEAEVLMIESTLRKNAMSGEDTVALKFFLERRAPDKFGKVTKATGATTDDQLTEILNALQVKKSDG